MTPQITRRDGEGGYARGRQLTFRTITLWTFALALALVVVSNLPAAGVDAAAESQPSYEPKHAPVDGDGGGHLPDLFCEPRTGPTGYSTFESWSAFNHHGTGAHGAAVGARDAIRLHAADYPPVSEY